MKRLCTLGISVLAVLVIGAVAAATVSAAPIPEYGRCVTKLTREAPGYKTANCTKLTNNAKKAKYEWLSGPPPNPDFAIKGQVNYTKQYERCSLALFDEELAEKERAEAAEPSRTEREKELLIERAEEHEAAAAEQYGKAGKNKLECRALVEEAETKPVARFVIEEEHAIRVICGGMSGAGKYTGPRTVGNVTITFEECELKGKPCQSPLALTGEIVTPELKGELGIIRHETRRGHRVKVSYSYGTSLEPAAGPDTTFTEFSCGGPTFDVIGSAIRPAPKIDEMIDQEPLDFTQEQGEQKIEKFYEGPPELLEATYEEGGHPMSAPTGLKTEAKQVNAENQYLEINKFL